jgi:DNA-binding NarL/FixJ family response regulator
MVESEDPSVRSEDATRVLAVDDHGPFLVVMRRVVEATPGFELAAEADSGERAIDAADELHPDLVLMDVAMPGLDGIETTRRIKAASPSTVVVLVSATHPDDLPRAAAACPADEIVWKPQLRPRLLEEIWERHRAR